MTFSIFLTSDSNGPLFVVNTNPDNSSPGIFPFQIVLFFVNAMLLFNFSVMKIILISSRPTEVLSGGFP